MITVLKAIINDLEAKKVIKSIKNTSSLFYDEPPFYLYSAFLNDQPQYFKKRDYQVKTNNIVCGGTSFNSMYEALLKCVGESVERLCLFCYPKKIVSFASHRDLKQVALNPTFYKKNKSIEKTTIGWVRGYDLMENVHCLLPAQLVFLNYLLGKKEYNLTSRISTGAASGFNHESTLLRGIYEVIERDAFMNIYLNKITPPRINLKNFKNKTIENILKKLQRYRLKTIVFNITTNISIPTFLAIIIDQTGIGPAFSLGARSSLNIDKAVIESICEAFCGRVLSRSILTKKRDRNRVPKIIKTQDDRAVFWSTPQRIKELSFLLNQSTAQSDIAIKKYFDDKEELKRTIEILNEKKCKVYYADITLPFLKKWDYKVYKVIIPYLQPLYLDEEEKELRRERLKEVSVFFGKKQFLINKIPHPFL